LSSALSNAGFGAGLAGAFLAGAGGFLVIVFFAGAAFAADLFGGEGAGSSSSSVGSHTAFVAFARPFDLSRSASAVGGGGGRAFLTGFLPFTIFFDGGDGFFAATFAGGAFAAGEDFFTGLVVRATIVTGFFFFLLVFYDMAATAFCLMNAGCIAIYPLYIALQLSPMRMHDIHLQ